MSVNIVLKDKDRVYLAVDSQGTCGDRRVTQTNLNNIKMWKVDGATSCYISHCGNIRDACVIRTMHNLVDENENVDFNYVVKNVKRKIVQELIDSDYLDVSNDYIDTISSSFFFVYKDKAYSIETDLSIVEVDNYEAHGSSRYIATGSLASTVGLDPITRIKRALIASTNNIYVAFPVYVVDTKTNKMITIRKEDL